MPSPYPGMDPYLEAHWGDVHHSLVIYIRDEMQSQLPSDLRARVEERVFVHFEDELRRVVVPDVRVRHQPAKITSPAQAAGTATAVAEPPADPIEVSIEHEPITEGYIEIIETGGGRVITIVEIVSLANKYAGDGKEQYLKKQKEMKEAGVNIVEIDLLRQGPWVLVVPRAFAPKSYRAPYRICVWRGAKPDRCELYRATMREPLPVINIPLRPTDDDVQLDLQKLFERCYVNGGYDDIDYTDEPDPPLDRKDAEWSHALLCEKGYRSRS